MSVFAIKERPCLMSAPMVNATLAGLKTQTRRLVKLGMQFQASTTPGYDFMFRGTKRGSTRRGTWQDMRMDQILDLCPYGRVGDRLYVRETWALVRNYGEDGLDDWDEPIPSSQPWSPSAQVWYRAGHPWEGDGVEDRGFRWRPAIHMPRWASRILLEIEDVRVERLHDISEADAMAEGFDVPTCERVFRKAAGRARQEFGRWLEYEHGGEPATDGYGYWCLDCVEKAARRHKADICGWNEDFTSDVVPRCEDCGVQIRHSLTKYGVERELGFTDNEEAIWPHLPVSGDESLTLAELADGMGDLQDEHHGRLAQIAFATLWEQINGKGSWAANPWLWAITFRRINA